jgi:4,5-dihydroxyphthalate decarboxylase
LEAGLTALRQRGHYPINHTVVVRDDLIAAHTALAVDVFNAFAASKRHYLEDLKAGRIDKPSEVDEVHRRVMEITGDPLPYGIAPNRKVLEELIGHAVTQGIIGHRVPLEDLFVPGTRDLIG